MKRYIEPVIKINIFRNESVVTASGGYIEAVDTWTQENPGAKKAVVNFKEMQNILTF